MSGLARPAAGRQSAELSWLLVAVLVGCRKRSTPDVGSGVLFDYAPPSPNSWARQGSEHSMGGGVEGGGVEGGGGKGEGGGGGKGEGGGGSDEGGGGVQLHS